MQYGNLGSLRVHWWSKAVTSYDDFGAREKWFVLTEKRCGICECGLSDNCYGTCWSRIHHVGQTVCHTYNCVQEYENPLCRICCSGVQLWVINKGSTKVSQPEMCGKEWIPRFESMHVSVTFPNFWSDPCPEYAELLVMVHARKRRQAMNLVADLALKKEIRIPRFLVLSDFFDAVEYGNEKCKLEFCSMFYSWRQRFLFVNTALWIRPYMFHLYLLHNLCREHSMDDERDIWRLIKQQLIWARSQDSALYQRIRIPRQHGERVPSTRETNSGTEISESEYSVAHGGRLLHSAGGRPLQSSPPRMNSNRDMPIFLRSFSVILTSTHHFYFRCLSVSAHNHKFCTLSTITPEIWEDV